MKFLFKILVVFLSLQSAKGWAMARNPVIGEEPLPLLFGDFDLTLKQLKIHFTPNENTAYSGRMKCQYIISSEQEKSIFLFSKLIWYYHKQFSVKVNGKPVETKDFDKKKLPPYVEKEIKINNYRPSEMDTLYYLKNTERTELWADDTKGFHAQLHKGENLIEIEWQDYVLYYRMDHYISDIKLISPSLPLHYWKKVEGIEIVIDHNPNKTIFAEANIGTPKTSNRLLQWNILQVPQEEIRIILRENPSWFAKVLITINPLGFGIVAFLLLLIFHLKLILKPNPKRLFLWIGIFLVPILSYAILLYSHNFIEWILQKNVYSSPVLFAVLTYPIFQVLYLIVMLVVFYSHKRNLAKEGRNE